MGRSIMSTTSPNPYFFLLASLPPLLFVFTSHSASHSLLRHSACFLFAVVILPGLECVSSLSRYLQLSNPSSPASSVADTTNEKVKVPNASQLNECLRAEISTPTEAENFPASQKHTSISLHERPIYRFSLFVTLVSVIFSLLHIIACISSASSKPSFSIFALLAPAAPKNVLELVLSLLSHAYPVFIGYIAAHEILHKVDSHSRLDRLLAWLYLSLVLNTAFLVDHHHHHMHLGTDVDSDSALQGETAYFFAVRREYGAWSRSFRNSFQRLRKSTGIMQFLISDRFGSGFMVSLAAVLAVHVFLGCATSAYYVALCITAMFLVDCAAHMQHYGLRRSIDGNTGNLESISVLNSWDSSYASTNVMTFNFGAHAHHHLNGALACPGLDAGIGPEYPLGFLCMTWISLIPPIFRSIADPIVREIERKKAAYIKIQ